MANIMTTYVKICNLNEVTFNKVKELFGKQTEESSEVLVFDHFNRLFGTNFDLEIDRQWMNKNIGSKWIRIEFGEYDLQVDLIIESAWSVPVEYISALVSFLNIYDLDIMAYGTYEDEGYSPVGAFVFAYGYDDIEDYDEVDSDLMWEDDDYNERIYDELYSFRDSLYESYLQVKNEALSN